MNSASAAASTNGNGCSAQQFGGDRQSKPRDSAAAERRKFLRSLYALKQRRLTVWLSTPFPRTWHQRAAEHKNCFQREEDYPDRYVRRASSQRAEQQVENHDRGKDAAKGDANADDPVARAARDATADHPFAFI